MKKNLLIACLALTGAIAAASPARAATSAPDASGLYGLTAVITTIDHETDLVAVATAGGLQYDFIGCDDYNNGDFVSLLMWDNGTPETVLDDSILNARYSGYSVE